MDQHNMNNPEHDQSTMIVAPENSSNAKIKKEQLLQTIRRYVREQGLIPPISLDELKEHAAHITQQYGIKDNRDFITVLTGNAIWESRVAAIPFNRRVLLLPHCIRTRANCPAEIDEFGLLCEQCGRCDTGTLQEEAESLGYVVLIAEGTTVVTELLKSGKIDCVIGVSCLSSLERSFPYTVATAVPGIAIPLLIEGCDSTKVDMDWIREAINLQSSRNWRGRLDLDKIKEQVEQWFESDSLSTILDFHHSQTEQIAIDWLITGGKRWRPYLSTAVAQAISNEKLVSIKKIAVAVECFHKASLIHDDIEDNDNERYGTETLHKKYGIPVAINIGDLLIGEGYRLIADSKFETQRLARMISIAALGHKELCLGQGAELMGMEKNTPLSVEKMLQIFKQKTAPAFEVALNLGAVAAGATDDICLILSRYSEALGIAYQIKDDIADYQKENPDNEIATMRPNLLSLIDEHNLVKNATQMLDDYRNQALNALRPIRNQSLKSLLFRITYKILGSPQEIQQNHGSNSHQLITQVNLDG